MIVKSIIATALAIGAAICSSCMCSGLHEPGSDLGEAPSHLHSELSTH